MYVTNIDYILAHFNICVLCSKSDDPRFPAYYFALTGNSASFAANELSSCWKMPT